MISYQYYNGSLITKRESYGDINFYVCADCYKLFKDKKRCTDHYMMDCNLFGHIDESKIIWGNFFKNFIVRISPSSHNKIKNVCYNLSYLSKEEQENDFCDLREGLKGSFCFLFYKNKRPIGIINFSISYGDYYDPVDANEYDPYKGCSFTITNIYVVPEERKNGYCNIILQESLRSLCRTLNEVIHTYPFHSAIIKILKNKCVNEIKVNHNGYLRRFDIKKNLLY